MLLLDRTIVAVILQSLFSALNMGSNRWQSGLTLQLFVLAALTFFYSEARIQRLGDILGNSIEERAEEGGYNYDRQGKDWTGTCATGKRQSPIELVDRHSITRDLPRIQFHYYNQTLQSPLVLVNNGHTANMVLPLGVNGQRAYITGGLLPGEFEAQSVHFHWGSERSRGSEHTINNERYDVEMHIVHKNVRYATVAEASQNWDGLAVLGVMLKAVYRFASDATGLNNIFDQLPQITQYESSATVNGPLTVGDLMGDVGTARFYSYNGSLTTPDCSEAVTWTVYKEPLRVSQRQIRKFWNLRDPRNRPLVNNYRTVQKINGRPVYHRALRS